LLWPLETFGDPLKRHPQKLQEATESLTQLRPDSFERSANKMLEGVSVSSESSQEAVSAYSRTALTKKKSGICLCPSHCAQLQLVLPTRGRSPNRRFGSGSSQVDSAFLKKKSAGCVHRGRTRKCTFLRKTESTSENPDPRRRIWSGGRHAKPTFTQRPGTRCRKPQP